MHLKGSLLAAYEKRRLPKQLLLMMKFTAILLLAACLASSAKGIGQTVTLDEKNASLDKIFREIKQQTGYNFLYNDDWLSAAKKVSISVRAASLTKVLDLCFKGQPFSYTIIEKTISLRPHSKKLFQNTNNKSEEINYRTPIDVKGMVTDEDGNPLKGATITVRNTGHSTETNGNGIFELKGIDENSILEISYTEFEKRSISVGGKTVISVSLKRVNNPLDEVQVIAYGRNTNRLQTGNVSSVRGEVIEKQPVTNPFLGLQGRVPGLVISQGSGYSTGAITIQLRGLNSLTQGSSPLFIVDGIPLASQNNPLNQLNNASASNNDWSPGGISPLHLLNASDIESIEVLKDADATAIYGSRGANGVILITTRKGKAGRIQVQAELSHTSSKVTNLIKFMNTEQYIEMRREAFLNDGIIPTVSNAPDLFLWDTTLYTDFPKFFLGGRAITQNANIAIQGGSDHVQFRFGGTYLTESTVLPIDFKNQKITAHTSINYKAPDSKWTSQTTISMVSSKNELPSFDVAAFIDRPPHLRLFRDGQLNWEEGGVAFNDLGLGQQSNPMSYLLSRYTGSFQNLNASSTLEYELLKKIKLRVQGGYNLTIGDEISRRPSASIDPFGTDPFPRADFANAKMQTWIVEPQIELNHTNKWGDWTILAGATLQELDRKVTTISANNYSNDLLLESPAGAGTLLIGNTYGDYRYSAIFGRLQFNRKDKYLFSLTGRRDGSSRFGPESQFNSFGSIGAAWIFSSEDKIKKLFPFISFGKIRGSYGVTGSDQIGDYTFMDTWRATNTNYLGNVGLQQMTLFNPELAWETNRKIEAGLHLGFLNNRIDLSIAVFRNRSGNQLISYLLPAQTGFTSIARNLDATVENKGFEMMVGGQLFRSDNFRWRSAFNVSIQSNRLLKFPDLELTSYANVFSVGHSISVQRLYENTGIGSNGFYTFRDIDQSGNYTIADRILLRNNDPKWFGGWNNEFLIHKAEVTLFFQLVRQSGWNYLKTLGNLVPGTAFKNQPTYALERWKQPGDVTRVQRYTTIASGSVNTSSQLMGSDAAIGDASFIRLKNVSVSYPIVFRRKQTGSFPKLDVYLQAQNLLTITKFKGADPENQSILRLPPLKSIRIGIRIKI